MKETLDTTDFAHVWKKSLLTELQKFQLRIGDLFIISYKLGTYPWNNWCTRVSRLGYAARPETVIIAFQKISDWFNIFLLVKVPNNSDINLKSHHIWKCLAYIPFIKERKEKMLVKDRTRLRYGVHHLHNHLNSSHDLESN